MGCQHQSCLTHHQFNIIHMINCIASYSRPTITPQLSPPLHNPCPLQVDLVGPRTPLALLISRYEASSPVLAAKLLSLQDEFPTTRRVAGDGNCFYRAFVFALLEAILEQPDPALHARLAARVQGLWGAICTHMAPDADAAAGHALLLEFLSRVWYIAETASAGTPGAGSSSSTAAAGLQPRSDGASTSQQQAQQEQQGQQGPAMPLYVGDLEAGLRRREVFDPIIKFARLASSWELRSRPERYEPFLAVSEYSYLLATVRVCCTTLAL